METNKCAEHGAELRAGACPWPECQRGTDFAEITAPTHFGVITFRRRPADTAWVWKPVRVKGYCKTCRG